MKIYNTLLSSRKPQNITPLDSQTVRIYSCGPTVYDHAHIGNLSAYIFADTLRRAIALAGFDVLHVMNYTDVDDKTIRRSHEEYPKLPAAEALKRLGDKYIAIFADDMRAVGNDVAAVEFIRATDAKTIWGMKDLITRLHAGGFAYIADDGVYFSIEAYRKSGKTYGQLLEVTTGNTSEARIQNDEYDKESAHDFALWKKQKDGEPAWDFELDGHGMAGRPGWHIECSVMSRQSLGQPFDIHTGGVDLIFPHHENEIAQSTALEKNPVMATIFAHNEHILIDGKKMSKSLHNFYTLEDLVQKGYDPLAFRLKMLQSHYRSQTNFTWEGLDAAGNLLQNLRAWADQKHQKAAHKAVASAPYASLLKEMLAASQDDLNMPRALKALADLAGKGEADGVDPDKIQPLLNVVDRLFGLRLAARPDITHAQKDLLAAREAARQQKDWAKSDELRAQLQSQGLNVRDTTSGPVWYRLAA
ncbi:MAG TPA: cysteine--tRNA ligase [Candidatus Saccharimonadales bacterium]|nr:cysteine--tRNA ligase [Candidatus Saccharimonadales bacterium]